VALVHSSNIAFVAVGVSLRLCACSAFVSCFVRVDGANHTFRGGSFQHGFFVVLMPGVGDRKYSPYLAPGTLVLDSMCESFVQT